jgi:hypothetical protein
MFRFNECNHVYLSVQPKVTDPNDSYPSYHLYPNPTEKDPCPRLFPHHSVSRVYENELAQSFRERSLIRRLQRHLANRNSKPKCEKGNGLVETLPRLLQRVKEVNWVDQGQVMEMEQMIVVELERQEEWKRREVKLVLERRRI